MSMTTLDQLAVIPALLVTLAALLALRDDDAHKGQRRFLLFLPALGVALLGLVFVGAPRPGPEYNPLSSNLPILLSPAITGLTALTLLNLKAMTRLTGRARILALALLLLFIALFAAGALNPRLPLIYLVLPGAILIVLGWLIGRRYSKTSVFLALLALALVLVANHWIQNPPGSRLTPPPNMVLQLLMTIGIMGVPGLLVVIAAGLIAGALSTTRHRLPQSPEPETAPAHDDTSTTRASGGGRRLGPHLVLPALLLGVLAYLQFWWSVWDNTVDMGFGAFTIEFTGPAAIGAGMVMTIHLFRKALPVSLQSGGVSYQTAQRHGGKSSHVAVALLFLVLVPLAFYQIHVLGMRQSHHAITEERAARIAAALQDYHAREGRYPQNLQALVPHELLIIPGPVILVGEDWCYRGGEDDYQLAAFHREFFSSPVSLQLYAKAGQPSPADLPCSERLAEMKERYYSPMEDPQAMQPPVPTPLPTVQLPGGKTVVQPVLDGATVSPGSWSPDGAYYVFGAQTATLTLHFLDAHTGDICPTASQVAYAPTLRGRHAWLPVGEDTAWRLLFLDTNGEMLSFTPCQSQAQRVTERFETSFTSMPAATSDGSHILLQSEDAYWILNGKTLEIQRIAEITPNPYDLHWDTFAWLPIVGDIAPPLAIAQLNGRDGSEGSTLYLIDGDSGDVRQNLLLASGGNQSPGFIEGLPGQRVLMHGDGKWLIFDFSAAPPTTTDIMPDIFDLDVAYPHEVSAAGAFIQEDGQNFYLATRLNHPRNKATYLYDSATGEVHVFDHEHHSLLLFPHGEIVEMANLEQVQEEHDTYDLVRIAEPDAAPQRLVFEGHTPRDYPHLSIKVLSQTDQIAVASAHGVSLVSLPGGERNIFYDLPGPGFSPWLDVAPDGSAFVAGKEGGSLYGPLP